MAARQVDQVWLHLSIERATRNDFLRGKVSAQQVIDASDATDYAVELLAATEAAGGYDEDGHPLTWPEAMRLAAAASEAPVSVDVPEQYDERRHQRA